jgi:carboxyl-terminal processing protease
MSVPRLIPFLALLLIPLPALRAAAPPAGARIAALIARLGSADYEEREQATAALAELEDAAGPALKRTATTTTDAEVRRRVRYLIHLLGGDSQQPADFTRELLEICEVICESSVAEPKAEQLVVWAVQAVFGDRSKPLPPDLARRLKRVPGMSAKARAALLCEAHRRVWRGRCPDVRGNVDRVATLVLKRCDPYGWMNPHPKPFGFGEGVPVGLGLKLETDSATRMARAVTPIKDGPAYRAGIRAGDLITQIAVPTENDEKDANGVSKRRVVSTAGLPLARVEDLLRGYSGTRVGLSIRREGRKKSLHIEVKRGLSKQETVLGWRRRADDSWDYLLDPANRIAYVRLTSFGRETVRDLQRVLTGLSRKGMKGLVLDLRFNPGGLLVVGMSTADLFLRGGMVLTIRNRPHGLFRLPSKRAGRALEVPLVCLVNGETAMTAEVLAAYLQDHKRALIVGERSRGQASVRNVQPHEGRELFLTTGVFIRPRGQKLDRMRLPGRPADEWGVQPDRGLLVKLSAREREALRLRLRQSEIIRHRYPPELLRPGPDRQRDLALATLRARLARRPGRS